MNMSCCGEGKQGTCACSGTVACAARWVYAVPLFLFGLFHFLNGQTMVGMLAGWPAALFFVYLSGAGLILAAIAIVINRYTRLACTLLAIELGIFILALHVPAIIAGGSGAQMSVALALKDIAILGGALMLVAHSSNRGFSAK